MKPAFREKLFDPIFHLLFPHLCAGCGSDLIEKKDHICYKCMASLPRTGFEAFADNPVEKIFWGRLQFVSASASFYFTKDSEMQNLIYEMKYRGNKNLGIFLGELMGENLFASDRYKNVDAIIPLPLHAAKEKKRGYNQAELLCKGISNILQVPVTEKNVVRIKQTETQTRKHRTARWKNVQEGFMVLSGDTLKGKHLLLIDDVLTTGATIESCAGVMHEIPGVTISVAVLAVAGI